MQSVCGGGKSAGGGWKSAGNERLGREGEEDVVDDARGTEPPDILISYNGGTTQSYSNGASILHCCLQMNMTINLSLRLL